MKLGLAFVLALTTAFPASSEEVDVVERALRDELARSMEELRLEELERPYFISYRVDDLHTVVVEASLGSLLASGEDRQRYLHLELRVGDYELDSSNFLSFPSFGGTQIVSTFGGVTPLPLEDDYREIRRQVWLATDAAYKQALEDLAKKKAALQNKRRTDEVPDFSRAEPVEIRATAAPLDADRAGGERLAEELSALFRALPHVATSQVDYHVSRVFTRYVNSEGTFYTRTYSDVVVAVKAAAQAADGHWIEDYVTAFGRRPEDLPASAELVRRVEEMGARLAALADAELLERYNGPVLFEAEAAAELLAQVFVPKLLAQRRPVAGDERMGRMAAARESDFKDRLGARVLPRFLSVTDDPTASATDGRDLYGGYPVDDEGVVGGPTKLVERGFLKTLLADRTPVAGVTGSSGNARAGGVAPSNLFFRVERDGMTPEELRRELAVWVADRGAEYGVVVKKIGSPFFQALDDRLASMVSFAGGGEDAVAPIVEAYKVYPDGREELLRNVEISGLSVQSFREIVAAAAEPETFHRPFRPVSGNPFGRFSRQIPLVSLVVPSLLFEELTLKRPSGEVPQPPAVPHPLREK